MTLNEWGALCFGLVVGWVTYRTIRRAPTSGLSDIATVIGAVGGAAVTALFPSTGRPFGAYGIGLAIGFAFYLGTALLVAGRKADEWLGAPLSGGGAPGAPATREEIPPFRR